jgi:formylglycine-generating enzyme required for sulfatase activity
MLAICPNVQCRQKIVFVQGYGKLPRVCPRCGADLERAADSATPSSQAPPPAGERAVSLDGADMVYVPAGTYIMGSDLKEIEAAFETASQKYTDVLWVWFERELPRHKVDLPGFWIDVVPVTCTCYKRFCDAMGHKPPKYWTDGKIPDGRQDHPVVNVSWEDALAYCSWAGKRPPYESEWEKAARGTDERIWPWGNEYREACGNIDSGMDAGTQPVGSFPAGASPYGCMDMAGNVFEWTRDICVQYPGFQETDDLRKLRREQMRQQHCERIVIYKDGASVKESLPFQLFRGVARGGSWASCSEYCRAAFRLEVESPGGSLVGFRCVLGEDPCDQSRDSGREGRHEESLAAAERSLALSPNYPTALYNAGRALENLGRFREASEKFHHLITVWPTDHGTWNHLGLCQSRLNKTAGAIHSFDTAININPFNADYWYNKALELEHMQNAMLTPYAITSVNGRTALDLTRVPVATVQAAAILNTEATGCYFRAQRLGAEDGDVVNGHAIAKQNAQTMLDNLRGRLGESDFLRVTAHAGFGESFPTIQHVWAVIRKYHAEADFSYEPMRKRGFDDKETSTGLSYLKTWGRIEATVPLTFRVIRKDEISSYDPWGEFV